MLNDQRNLNSQCRIKTRFCKSVTNRRSHLCRIAPDKIEFMKTITDSEGTPQSECARLGRSKLRVVEQSSQSACRSPFRRTPSLNPKGIASSSPGLRGTSYPGSGQPEWFNPKGVVSFPTESTPSEPQPLWGCILADPFPRVARDSRLRFATTRHAQPWALWRNPFGILLNFFVITSLILIACSTRAATNDVSALLQKGLFEEEANRNLDAAIQAYQSVINETDKHHQFAATAIFRLAECYRKQGKTQEANALYERILREFPDQADLVKLSEQQVGHSVASPSPGGSDDVSNELQKQILAAQTEAESSRKQFQYLDNLKPQQRRVAVQQTYPNPVLNSLMQKLTETEQELAKLLKDMGANHPDVKRAVVLRDEIEKQIDDQTDGVLRGLEAKIKSAEETAKELETRLQQARLASSPATAATASPSEPADPEAEEIKQLEAMIKDSPDLVNANNPLSSAVANRRLKVVAFLLDHKANLEARDPTFGETPLLTAARHGNKEMVELLLNRGAIVSATVIRRTPGGQSSDEGNTALHYAAENGYKSVAEALLAHGADVNSLNSHQRTPLHFAAEKGFKAVAELLLVRGANPNLKDDHGSAPLHLAVQANDQTLVELLLASKADANSQNEEGWTPLHIAASKDLVEIAKLLLANGANVNTSTPKGSTPLTEAAAAGGPEMIRLLLAHHADVNARRNDGGFTALLWAVNNNRLDNAKLLLAGGAQVDVKSDQHLSPLHLAVWFGWPEMVKTILAHKPDLEILNGNGHTSLQESVIKPQLEIAGLLLDAGADPNVPYKDVDNASPLQLAAVRLDKPMVELLVAHKADLNLQDRYGNTALSRMRELAAGKTPSPRAQIAGREIAELLRKAGADENLQRLSIIGVSRGDFEQNLFFRGTNSYNRYTLFELLQRLYGPDGPVINGQLPRGLHFPDLSRIKISRLIPGGGTQDFDANQLHAFQSGDCSDDRSLEWGDIVEIPEQDHLVNESWAGLTSEVENALKKCLARSVDIHIKNETVKVTLDPGVRQGPAEGSFQARLAEATKKPQSSPDPTGQSNITLMSFDLKSVVHGANVIRASSDLSRVKVTRTDPATKKVTEFVLPLETSDFWLRDGDVIEIPEKP